MQNPDRWEPSRFVQDRRGRLRASRRPGVVHPGSRFVGDLQAQAYEALLTRHARPGRLVDLGCGRVPLYEVYAVRATEVLCVDWPAGEGTDFVDIVADLNTEALDIPSGSVATVLATDVLEHIRQPERVMDEIARVLEPGGVALITVPFLYWIHDEPDDHHRYTEYRLRDLAEGAGLTILEIDPYGGPVEVMIDIFLKHVARWNWLSRVLTPVAQAARRGLTGLTNWRRYPLGYTLAAIRSVPPSSTS